MKSLLLLLFMLLFWGCKPNAHTVGGFTVEGSKEFEQTLVIDSESPQGVWARDGIVLNLKPKVALTNALFRKVMVMVSYHSDAEYQQLRLLGFRSWFHAQHPEMGHGYVLLALDDGDELNDLARYVHRESVFSCGKLEVLNLANTMQTTLDSYTPARYLESVALSSVASLLESPSTAEIEASIAAISGLGTRFHNTVSGLSATQFISDRMQAAIGSRLANIEFEQFTHGLTQQKSLIVRIPGADPTLPILVVGGHLDSIHGSKTNSDQSNAPGADDDASGVAVMIEALRVIAVSGATFQRTIEFHAYAAEEIGLVGSKDIAARYRNTATDVAAMLQLDMAAFSPNDGESTIYLVTDDTSTSLRRSLKDLLVTYLDGDYEEGTIGSGGTSDHRSWTAQGYHAVFPFEHPQLYNKAIHTVNDTMATINNLPLATRFTQLVLAFLCHHGGLVSAASEYEEKLAAAGVLEKDLAVAVVNTTSSGVYHLIIGSDEDTVTVEACEVESAEATGCSGDRLAFSDGGARGTRHFHVGAQELTLADPTLVRLFGYNAAGVLSQLRNVLLEKK